MTQLEAPLLTLIIRWVHLAAMALALGGALLVSSLCVGDTREGPAHERLLLSLANRYEWLFWAALALLVMTGVGNLGARAASLPEPGSVWDQTLGIKLLVVLGCVAFSIFRTLVVARLLTARPVDVSPPVRKLLQGLYAATAAALAAIVGLAVWLAHA